MRTALNIIGSLILVSIIAVGGAIIALPHFLSTDLVKSKVAELVHQKTGRKLTIGGKTSFKLFPNIAVSLDDITLSNPPGMSGPPLVQMGSLRTNLKLMPLFKGQTEVDSVTLINPRFDLQVDKSGKRNWDFKAAQNDGGAGSSSTGNSSLGKSFSLGSVTIKNGSVRYVDARGSIDERIEAINIELVQKSSDGSIRTTGNLRWHHEILNITSKVMAPDELIAGKPSNVQIKLKSRYTDSQYDGLLTPGDAPSIDGYLISDTPSVRKLAAFLGHDLPSNKGFGKLKIKAKITASANKVQFTTSQFLFDNMDLVADGTIKLNKARPYIIANVEADRLDLNLYTRTASTGSTTRSVGSAGKAADTPVDLSGLKAVNGRFSIKTKEILYQKARLGQGYFKITMNNGRAKAVIEQLSLYRGSATGNIIVDGSRSRPFIGGNLALKDVLTGAILRDFTGFDKLAGKGTVQGNFTVRGNSVKAMKKSLKGTLKMNIVNGRIEGFDLAKYVGDLTGNEMPGAGAGRGGKPMTAYDKMSGVLKINKGVAHNKDFLLKGKFFRVRAAGYINIVKETLRLRVAPKLFSGDWKFSPPLRVIGSWLKPKVKFDALAFLGGEQGIVRSLSGVLRGEKLDLGQVLQKRGLQNDAEIESYLAGKKISTRNDPPANDNAPDGNQGNAGSTGGSSSPLDSLLGGKNKKTGDLLKKLFQ